MNRPSLLVYFQPPGIELKEWMAASTRERCVAVNVRAEYLINDFVSTITDVPHQLRTLLSGGSDVFRSFQVPLSCRMFELASKLVDNPYTGALALIHTEAITLQLLCAAVAAFSSVEQTAMEPNSAHDLRRVQAARDLLMKQLSPATTIRQVSRAIGINESSLTRGFIVVFGETVFEFSVRCRMHHALKLLREERMSVARVAEAVGYSHQTSFATAFHRHFGLCPKDVRVQRPR